MRLLSLKRHSKALIALAACTLILAGCGDHDPKGFFDPGATGRWKSTPLVVPILDKLNIGVEQPDEQFAEATDVKPEDLVPHDHDYQISPNDLIAVSVGDLLGAGISTPQQVRVSPTGNIDLPSVGEIHAAGLTEIELQQQIVQAYRDAKLIQNAQVTVQVIEARGRTFSIIGAVPRPGQYPIMSNNFRILDALVLAGDTPMGSTYLYVIRPIKNKNGTTQPSQSQTQQPAQPDMGAQPEQNPFNLLTPEQPGSTTAPTGNGTSQDNLNNAPGGGIDPDHTVQMADETPMPASAPAASEPVVSPTASPTTQPAVGEPEGHIVLLEGKPEQVGGVAGAQPTTMEVASQANVQTAEAPTTQPSNEKFEFNLPPGATRYREIRVPLAELKNGNMKYNIVVRPGDMIEIPGPAQGVYYVGGHVNRPGVYQIVGQQITLKQAVIAAGMFDQLAMPARTEIVRRITGDKEVYAEVNLDRIFAGEDPDIYIKPNDVLNVGTTFLSPFIAAIRNGFRITYGFGFIYDKNFNTEAEIGRRP